MTFVEITVALVIMTLFMLVAMPAFRTVFESDRQREFNRLVATVRTLCTEAVLRRQAYRLEFDLPEQTYTPQVRDPYGRYVPIPESEQMGTHALPETIRLVDMLPYGATAGVVTARPVAIAIDRSGFIDPFLLHLREDSEEWTLRVGFTCRPEILPGYVSELLESYDARSR
jgi:type II secretory pathway pseudopilin PulG